MRISAPYCALDGNYHDLDADKDLAKESQDSKALRYIGQKEPAYCECARFAKRPLAIKVWWSLISNNPGSLLDKKNLELSHEHLIFDQSGDNIGFGPKGLFSEDTSQIRYRHDNTCLDGQQVRAALRNMPEPGRYNFFRNNCQDFAKKVRQQIRVMFQ